MKILSKTLIGILLAAQMTGCAGYKKVPPTVFSTWPESVQNPKPSLKPDDFVKVTLHDGRSIEGTIESLNETGFVLTGVNIDPTQVQKAQIRELLWLPTVFVGAASVFTFIVLTTETGKFSTD